MANAEHDDEPLDLDSMQAIIGAVASTEKEIFGEAFGADGEPLDDSGDRSLEEMEAAPNGEEDNEADADGAKEHAELEAKDGKPEEQPRAEDGTFKAAGEKEEPAKAELTVAEQIAAAVASQREKDAAEFNARMAALEARVPQPKTEPKSEPKVPEAPDMFLDPQGYQNWVTSQMEARETRIRAESSLRFAALAHGETFKQAYAEFGKLNPSDPQHFQIGRTIAQAGDPGEAMVAWYRQNETLRRVGADPAAYEARVKDEARQALAKDPEFRKQLLAEMQGEAATGGDGGKPRAIVKLPPSLNGSSGSSSARIADPELLNGSERSIFEHAFRPQ